MLTDLCKELNNWFEVRDKDGRRSGRIFGTFTIKDGTLKIEGAQDGQYVRICDSVFNDGVFAYPPSGLKDETFEGSVWLLKIPDRIIELDRLLDEWTEKYADVLNSPYQSESFGGYSYTKASSVSSGSGQTSGGIWQSPYAHELSHWRKA